MIAHPAQIRTGKAFLFVSSLVAAGLLYAPGSGLAQQSEASVVIVHLIYANAQWSLGPETVKILPCEAPSHLIDGPSGSPRIRVLGPNNTVLLDRHIRNPRVALWEQPSTNPSLLDTASYKAKFPLQTDMTTFQFYDPNAQSPNVSVNLVPYIHAYMSQGGPKQIAPCKRKMPGSQ